MLTKPTTLYETLEITTDATEHEVREAYLRLKSAYNRDSVALYSLIGGDEREEILQKVEEAYRTLSDPEKRKEYDRCHEQLDANFESWQMPTPSHGNAGGSVVSIDRVPPMDTSGNSDDLLIPPSTDFAAARSKAVPQKSTTPDPIGWGLASDHESKHSTTVAAHSSVNTVSATDTVHPISADQALIDEIKNEIEWKGEFIKRIRETKKVAIEELAAITRVSKTTLLAIEAEDFKKLPAAVFTRGFLMQIARILKLPQDKFVATYMVRFKKARGEE